MPEAGLHTVRQLEAGTTLDALCSRYKLIARRHSLHPIVQLSYSQTDSDMQSPVVQECRGLILELNTWRVVAYPFAKFFNAREPKAAHVRDTFDWASAKCFEKLDGSILTLYWYGRQWNVATSKLPGADGQLPNGGGTFCQEFWDAWEASGYMLPERKDLCYMFELTLPQHTIVVRHERAALTLIGARRLDGTLQELDCEQVASANGWAAPPLRQGIADLEAAEAAAGQLNPVAHEGFVVVDRAWRRLKIKCPAYVALHHLGPQGKKGEEGRRLDTRRLLQVAIANEGDEWLSYYPAHRAEYVSLRARLGALCRLLDEDEKQQQLPPNLAGKERLASLAGAVRTSGGGAAAHLRRCDVRRVEEAFEEMPPPHEPTPEELAAAAAPPTTERRHVDAVEAAHADARAPCRPVRLTLVNLCAPAKGKGGGKGGNTGGNQGGGGRAAAAECVVVVEPSFDAIAVAANQKLHLGLKQPRRVALATRDGAQIAPNDDACAKLLTNGSAVLVSLPRPGAPPPASVAAPGPAAAAPAAVEAKAAAPPPQRPASQQSCRDKWSGKKPAAAGNSFAALLDCDDD